MLIIAEKLVTRITQSIYKLYPSFLATVFVRPCYQTRNSLPLSFQSCVNLSRLELCGSLGYAPVKHGLLCNLDYSSGRYGQSGCLDETPASNMLCGSLD